MSLCAEYKQQLTKINKLLAENIKKNKEAIEKDPKLIKYISDLSYLKSNLEFSIGWQTKAHAPGHFDGIDNFDMCHEVYEY